MAGKKTIKPVIMNADRDPTPGNPHSWLPLIGDPPGSEGTRILYGVLRPGYRGWANSAAHFAQVKLAPVPTPDGEPWAVTAARAEVLLPPGADDRYAEPQVLMEAVDVERPADKPVLLTYVTITFPTARLHEQYELVRGFLVTQTRALGCPVLLVQHAPHRQGSSNPSHCHCLYVPRRLSTLGLAAWVPPLCSDKGRQLIVDGFAAFRAGRPA
jgi:hypothetical protein